MPTKMMYGIVRKSKKDHYETVKSRSFNSKMQYAESLRDEGYYVYLVFSEMDYKKIARIISSRGFTFLNEKQRYIFEAYNETLKERGTMWESL